MNAKIYRAGHKNCLTKTPRNPGLSTAFIPILMRHRSLNVPRQGAGRATGSGYACWYDRPSFCGAGVTVRRTSPSGLWRRKIWRGIFGDMPALAAAYTVGSEASGGKIVSIRSRCVIICQIASAISSGEMTGKVIG